MHYKHRDGTWYPAVLVLTHIFALAWQTLRQDGRCGLYSLLFGLYVAFIVGLSLEAAVVGLAGVRIAVGCHLSNAHENNDWACDAGD
jgi:hypothetical protein